MKLTKRDNDELTKLIKKAISDKKLELEMRITDNITQNMFQTVLNGFLFTKGNRGQGLKYTVTSVLSVSNDADTVRVNIIGQDSIRLFWLRDELSEEISYNVELKERKSNYDFSDYPIRISLSEEKEGGEVKELINTKSMKTYRCKNRYEIISADNQFRFDLTTVKMAKGRNLRESLLFKKEPHYEIEMEHIGDLDNSGDIMHSFIRNSTLLLQMYQQSSDLITKSELETVIIAYKNMVNMKKSDRFSFIAANPVTLHIQNLNETYNPTIIGAYAVTDKADGIRNFLYVHTDGGFYLIDNNKKVTKCNIVSTKWASSLIEGEYMEGINKFFAYDMLFERGNDIRSKHLHKKTGECRLSYLSSFIKELENKTITEKSDISIMIKSKPYQFATGKDIFEKANLIWNKRGSYEYHIDGMIFIPYNCGYPMKSGTWDRLFKWKPEQLNSIDFLIKVVRNDKGEVKRSPYMIGENVAQYKSLELKVGGYRDTINKANGQWTKRCVPIDFSPPDAPANIGVANVPIDESGKIICQDPLSGRYYTIKDEMIVEFVYQKDPLFYWKPIRVREDKTERYRSGDPVYGNSEFVANDNWVTIQNPVTEEMITIGKIQDYIMEKAIKQAQNRVKMMHNKGGKDNKKVNFVDEESKKKDNSYYSNTNTKKFNYSERLPFQHFHNSVVKRELIKEVAPSTLTDSSKPVGTLLDLAAGKGGDLPKWKDSLYKEVVGLDIDKSGLEYAEQFYKEYKGKPKPEVHYVWADSSKLIFPDYVAAMDTAARDKLEEYLPEKNQFDVVSLQFALHYFFKSEITLRTLLQNVTDNLKVGGHFIGTCFDGMKLNKELKKSDKIEGKLDGKTVWKISKQYSGSNAINRANYGKAIDVFVTTIGQNYTEYLVNLTYLTKICKEYGLELVKEESFEEYHKRAKSNQHAKEMSEIEKQFSFLSSVFIFKKSKEPSTAPAKKLEKLLKSKKSVTTKEEDEIISLEISKATSKVAKPKTTTKKTVSKKKIVKK